MDQQLKAQGTLEETQFNFMHSHEGSLASISKDSGLMTSADLIGQQIHEWTHIHVNKTCKHRK